MKQLLIIVLFVFTGITSAFCNIDEEEITKADTLKIGDYCPDFNMESFDRQPVKISSLKGKYVYIDVWASWCYPCRKQFPFFEELVEEFKTDDIVFLGMNIDERDFRWLGTIENLHLKGEQWRALDKDFENKFFIEYIPRFILLDKEGKILESRMTAPSKAETKEYLIQILNK